MVKTDVLFPPAHKEKAAGGSHSPAALGGLSAAVQTAVLMKISKPSASTNSTMMQARTTEGLAPVRKA